MQEEPYVVLVTGGRDCSHSLVHKALDHIFEDGSKNFILVNGDAKGADIAATKWAEENGVTVIKCPANWTMHGKGAGPIRNQMMVDLFKPRLVIAFPGGNGTEDCVRKALKAAINLLRVTGTHEEFTAKLSDN